MKNTKLSIIIPVFNMDRFLSRCLDSVLVSLRGRLDFEVIVVDDGSTDGSSAICDDYVLKHSQIKAVHQKNAGRCAARNAGIKIACGEYVTFIDSDDYVLENFAEVFDLLNDSFDVLSFNFEQDGKIIGTNETQEYRELTGKDIISLFRSNKFNSACTKIFKRELILKNDLFFGEGSVAEDLEFVIRATLSASSWKACALAYYVYYTNETSTMNVWSVKRVKDSLANCEKVFCSIDSSMLTDEEKKKLKSILVKNVYLNFLGWKRVKKDDRKELVAVLKANKKLFLRPSGLDAKMVYISIKLLGVKNTLRLMGGLR